MPEAAASDPRSLLGPLNEVEEKHAPPRLYITGDSRLLEQGTRVAVVGSRRASPGGLELARSLARELVKREVVVVSGLALGIDAAAHLAAIEAGGRTIAVLGTSLTEFAPPSNRRLQELIAREHLLVTQFAPGTPTRRGNFPMRNRTMALLSDATVIVEAGESSGTMHQGWEALRLGRLLFVLEPLAASGISWVSDLLAYGAEILVEENLDRVVEHLPKRACGDALAF